MFISLPVPVKEYEPHFNEPLYLPPELSWNLKTDRRSDKFSIFPPGKLGKSSKKR